VKRIYIKGKKLVLHNSAPKLFVFYLSINFSENYINKHIIVYVCQASIRFTKKLMIIKIHGIQGKNQPGTSQSFLSYIEMLSLLTALNRNHFKCKQNFAKMNPLSKRAFYCYIVLADCCCNILNHY
jgi:hypothetical protein